MRATIGHGGMPTSPFAGSQTAGEVTSYVCRSRGDEEVVDSWRSYMRDLCSLPVSRLLLQDTHSLDLCYPSLQSPPPPVNTLRLSQPPRTTTMKFSFVTALALAAGVMSAAVPVTPASAGLAVEKRQLESKGAVLDSLKQAVVAQTTQISEWPPHPRKVNGH